jgi:hypothetical protein
MSELTVSQIRDKRNEAERRIGEILASLMQDTGLNIMNVDVETEHVRTIGPVTMPEVTILLESP